MRHAVIRGPETRATGWVHLLQRVLGGQDRLHRQMIAAPRMGARQQVGRRGHHRVMPDPRCMTGGDPAPLAR